MCDIEMTARAAEKSIYKKKQENYAHIKQLLPAMGHTFTTSAAAASAAIYQNLFIFENFPPACGLSTKQGTIFGNRRSFFVRNFKL